MFKKRLISWLLGVPIVIVVTWFGEPWFTLLVSIWAVGTAFEFYRIITQSQKALPLTYFGLVWTLLFIINPHFVIVIPPSLLLTTSVIFPLIWLLARRKKEDAFVSWAWTAAGILYIGWLMSYLVVLRGIPNGRDWVFLALLPTFGSDTAAYLVGKAIGRHKLAPNISPGKTWEGAIGGIFGAVLVSLVVVAILRTPISYGEAIILGILVSAMGQLGGLVASMFKRNMGVKDSGNVLPGHGGFLDRADSLVFAVAAVYYCVLFAFGG